MQSRLVVERSTIELSLQLLRRRTGKSCGSVISCVYFGLQDLRLFSSSPFPPPVISFLSFLLSVPTSTSAVLLLAIMKRGLFEWLWVLFICCFPMGRGDVAHGLLLCSRYLGFMGSER